MKFLQMEDLEIVSASRFETFLLYSWLYCHGAIGFRTRAPNSRFQKPAFILRPRERLHVKTVKLKDTTESCITEKGRMGLRSMNKSNINQKGKQRWR